MAKMKEKDNRRRRVEDIRDEITTLSREILAVESRREDGPRRHTGDRKPPSDTLRRRRGQGGDPGEHAGEWMEEDVEGAGDEVLNHLDDLKADSRIDDAKFGEYKAEVLQAKKIMGDALWELMLIQKEADENKQTATIFKESLHVKYFWERKLTRKHF